MSPGPIALTDHAPPFTAAALVLCFTAGWLLAVLAQQVRVETRRMHWLLGAPLLAGVVALITLAATASPAAAASHVNMLPDALTLGAAALLSIGAGTSMVAARRCSTQAEGHAALHATALQHMSSGLVLIGPDGRLELSNERFAAMFGLEKSPRPGLALDPFLELVGDANAWAPEKRAKLGQKLAKRLASGTAARVEHTMTDGRTVAVESRPVSGGGAVLTFDDVTEDRRAQSQIAYMAFHDPVTGLPNRRALQARLHEAFPPKLRFKLMLIDLDRFKTVNDTFGHAMGDRLLADVAKRIRTILQPGDFLARIGGDEFATLVQGDENHALAVAAELITGIAKPFAIDGLSLVVGCSVGLCCSDDVVAAEELMTRADLALYEAKRSGRGRAFCYRPGMLEEVAERNLLEMDMRVALRQRQFHLVYQPIVSLRSGRVTGYEALIRWRHPALGFVAPARFIPIAEESGQIVPIGLWVLEEACREATSWIEPLSIAVNLSPLQLRTPTVIDDIADVLRRTGLPAGRLEVELTETALMQDCESLGTVLATLRELGIKVAMDDFGTGYSSLVHLRHLPLDRIKIDRCFVSSAERDPHSLAVLKAVMQIGRDLAIETVAEGVETDREMQLLCAIGCDSAQGHHIGRPDLLPNESRFAQPASLHGRLARAS